MPEDGKSHSDLPEVVQGIHVAGEDSPVLEREMKGGMKEGDYGGEGEVSAWEERAVHMLEQMQPFSLVHIFCQR